MAMRWPSILILAGWSVGWLAACQSAKPSEASFRIDYISPGTFRWGSYQGLSLISVSPGGFPQLSSAGRFAADEVTLLLAEEEADGSGARTLPILYQPPRGDGATVDFSRFEATGKVAVIRRHQGMDYVKDWLVVRDDGLDVVDREAVPLVGDPSPEDILQFGHAYFEQREGSDPQEALRRFFQAGVHYPKLALEVIAHHENRAEDQRDPGLGRETLRYRARFELLQELEPVGEASVTE
jgi:hypothetical protein